MNRAEQCLSIKMTHGMLKEERSVRGWPLIRLLADPQYRVSHPIIPSLGAKLPHRLTNYFAGSTQISFIYGESQSNQ